MNEADASAFLASLRRTPGFRGSAIVARDGIPEMSDWDLAADVDMLAAMGAAIMGAADASLQELGGQRVRASVITAHDLRIILWDLDARHILLAVTDSDVDLEHVEQAGTVCRDGLRQVMA